LADCQGKAQATETIDLRAIGSQTQTGEGSWRNELGERKLSTNNLFHRSTTPARFLFCHFQDFILFFRLQSRNFKAIARLLRFLYG
jgi:hypothetical protein